MVLLNFDNIADFNIGPSALLKNFGLIVEAQAFPSVQLIVRLVALVVLICLLEHREDQNEGKGENHGHWALRTK